MWNIRCYLYARRKDIHTALFYQKQIWHKYYEKGKPENREIGEKWFINYPFQNYKTYEQRLRINQKNKYQICNEPSKRVLVVRIGQLQPGLWPDCRYLAHPYSSHVLCQFVKKQIPTDFSTVHQLSRHSMTQRIRGEQERSVCSVRRRRQVWRQPTDTSWGVMWDVTTSVGRGV